MPFELDDFQLRACAALEGGHGVLVCAPTGAGKTVVGEFAVHLALARGPQVLLHDADQGAVQPEVRRPRRAARAGRRRAAHRRHRRQRRRAGGGDDHRGAAQHDLRGQQAAGRPRLRRDGRGALPGRPVPRRRVGGGDPAAPRARRAGQPVGHGQQRRGVRRLAGHRARRHRGRRRRAPAGAAVAAHDGRLAAVRHVRPVGRRRARGRPRAGPPDRRPGAPERRVGPRPPRGRRGRDTRFRPPSRVTSSTGSTATACCPPSRSSSAARAATPPSASACAPGCGSPPRTRWSRSARRSTAAPPSCRGRPRRARLLGVARGPRARHRRPPRGPAARVQGDGRGALRPRPRAGGVRHRDARAGHQHARPHRGAGTAGEVQRREPRRAHARASTRSSPGGPGGAASTSRATRW